MSFFDEIDNSPRFKEVRLPGKDGKIVVRYAHRITAAEMTQRRHESAAAMAGLPDAQADKLWRARLIALCILDGEDPNSARTFADTDLERIAGLGHDVEAELFDAVEEVNGLPRAFREALKKNAAATSWTSPAA